MHYVENNTLCLSTLLNQNNSIFQLKRSNGSGKAKKHIIIFIVLVIREGESELQDT